MCLKAVSCHVNYCNAVFLYFADVAGPTVAPSLANLAVQQSIGSDDHVDGQALNPVLDMDVVNAVTAEALGFPETVCSVRQIGQDVGTLSVPMVSHGQQQRGSVAWTSSSDNDSQFDRPGLLRSALTAVVLSACVNQY